MNKATVEYLKRDRRLDPSKTAILVVDAQMSEFNDEARAAKPDYVARIETVAVPTMQKLMSAARPLGIEVVYTVIESLTKNGRDRSLDHKMSDIHVPKGSPLAKMIPGIEPKEDDIVLPKTSSGVFNSTNAAYVLRNLGIENLIVVGFLTDQCVDMTVRDGADLGFYMVCVSDGCTTHTQERHETALNAFGGYCRVQTAEEVIATFE
ncbi:MAG: cysteine hydrolase [Rhodospirillales bacterium]|jgi:biuret amidohydrolase|nr:cysteine hydrolase [Rhodospirillales bacterium]MBT4627391.1 cysteine hydrolase [Rhodospirillales bacterium]MBT5351113.1 cysteine hydrolase [Rhodospirillales bacterium]MBT6109076.1 cysteine hydrolase [Rhodospirillales bacterium]MBT7145575.1 cysteine hydrolase [Rhodospirillales bacterium]